MRKFAVCLFVLINTVCVWGQQPGDSNEKRVALTETAVALDAAGVSALEATLRTTALNGAPDTPVTNIRMVVRNSSAINYAFVSGLVTFYDASGVRCGEGIFKADVLAQGESFETDTPGIRIRCTPVSWRIVATDLVPRVVPSTTPTPVAASRSARLVITVDGERHPIQLDKPLTLNIANKARTIIVSEAP